MPKIAYIERRFKPESLDVIAKSNAIIEEYQAQGLSLTLRQLYYQHVARGFRPNTEKSYDNLGALISDARLAGLVDWNAINDRTRNLRSNSHWSQPGDIIESAAYSYAIDKWADQPYRVEVWIEKEALAGVIEQICGQLDVPHFACRGYTSQSEMWAAARRFIGYGQRGQKGYIIHLGDHDPSGIDMTRDIVDRMRVFDCFLKVDRIALNMDQVDAYDPPPNPAKLTDSRVNGYIERFGESSWELDALNPTIIRDLISAKVMELRDQAKWDAAVERQERARQVLKDASAHWDRVAEYVEELAS